MARDYGAVVSASSLLERVANGNGALTPVPVVPTGYEPLDEIIGGGLRLHDLVLLAGRPGVGKTITALQWARHAARSGASVIFASYEHDEDDMFLRIVTQEIGAILAAETLLGPRGFRLQTGATLATIAELAHVEPVVREALDRIAEYAGNLTFVRASGKVTTLERLTELVDNAADHDMTLLVVDYLQKVPHDRKADNESEQVTRVTEALKDLAMSRPLTVLAVVAATSEGMTATRMRLHHLRGSTALAYDSDLVLVLDEKINAVSKVHLMYDPVRAATFQDQVLLTIEKNRSGPAHADLEFRKDLAHYRFDPRGGFVGERLVDERVNTV